jgi:hypothetical protein
MRRAVARLPIVGPALIDFARSLRDPEGERIVQADLAETSRALTWLRAAIAEPGPGARRLLVISLSDMVYQLKLEGMLAAALRLEGWRPIILTTARTSTRAAKYFRAFGITDFAYLEDFAPGAAEQGSAASDASRFLSGPLDFQGVKAWSYEGSWIGPQILSTVSRAHHQGAPDPTEPTTRAEIAALLPTVLERVLVARRLVATLRPDLALVIEANYALNGPFVDQVIAGGASVIQVIQPWRDDALTFKRLTARTRRMHPSSVSPETFERMTALPWGDAEEAALARVLADRYNGRWFLQARNQPNTRSLAAAELREKLGLDRAKKTATVFSHILWDANLFYGDDLFLDYGDWFAETVREAAANPRLNWLIKLHPANLWKRARERVDGEFAESRLIRERIGALPEHVRLLFPDTDISTESLFAFTDYGITVRGTAGMELPCLGKPTLTAGTGRYSGLGFTIDSASRDEYLARLAALETLPPMTALETERARRHAHAAFLKRPWRMTSFRSVFDYGASGSRPLDHNLHAVATSRAEATDLARFAAWAATDDVDYLEN